MVGWEAFIWAAGKADSLHSLVELQGNRFMLYKLIDRAGRSPYLINEISANLRSWKNNFQ